jgi:Skp family chaperone for outer membrane proteins
MASVANRETTSAMVKVLGGVAAAGTFFSLIDMARNRSVHNFTSLCIFGFVCFALFKAAAIVKRPSFANFAQVGSADTVIGRKFGTPAWVRPAIWAGLFLITISFATLLFASRATLHLEGGRFTLAFMGMFALYLLACQRSERFARGYLRHWYPDQPQVAIGAEGLWITGTAIPWTSLRAVSRRIRRVKVIGVDTIVVTAQAAKRAEDIEIDLSDSVEDKQALYDKLRSAAAAHGAKLVPEGQTSPIAARPARERAAAARKNYDDWQATLPQEIAKTESQLEEVRARIAQSEAKISELEGALLFGPGPRGRSELLLEQTRKTLSASMSLRDSLEKLLATQRNALEKRR